jgi:DNA-binding transcriptional ArsR family regulator
VRRLADKESADILKGTALDIYRLMLRARKPLGIREIQRALNISSPSVAQHHLSKLERTGLVKREMGNYVINKVLLENCIKISRFIVPRYLFYSIFALTVLLIELTFLRPNVLHQIYFFSVIATIIFLLIFCYETARVWLRGSL